jgi:cytochrome c oxidase assembly protein Cox11
VIFVDPDMLKNLDTREVRAITLSSRFFGQPKHCRPALIRRQPASPRRQP